MDAKSKMIICPDVHREARLPPGQRMATNWPVMSIEPTPKFDAETWDLALFPLPLVDPLVRFSWHEFLRLPRTQVLADMHCVTGWSTFDHLWEGVATRELLNHVSISPNAKYVMIHSELNYCTNLSLEDFFAEDAILAFRHNGLDLSPDHGYPLRLVIPRLYAWKSAKWVRGIEFMELNHPGYWEDIDNGAYHMRGDPWTQERNQVSS